MVASSNRICTVCCNTHTAAVFDALSIFALASILVSFKNNLNSSKTCKQTFHSEERSFGQKGEKMGQPGFEPVCLAWKTLTTDHLDCIVVMAFVF